MNPKWIKTFDEKFNRYWDDQNGEIVIEDWIKSFITFLLEELINEAVELASDGQNTVEQENHFKDQLKSKYL